jgi:hypothetical protein
MLGLSPRATILIGFVLVLLGAVIPFLGVMQIIPFTEMNFYISIGILFFSFGASVLGLFLGIIGASQYIRSKRQ